MKLYGYSRAQFCIKGKNALGIEKIPKAFFIAVWFLQYP